MNIGKLPMVISLRIRKPKWKMVKNNDGHTDHFECEGRFAFGDGQGANLDGYILNYGVVKGIELVPNDAKPDPFKPELKIHHKIHFHKESGTYTYWIQVWGFDCTGETGCIQHFVNTSYFSNSVTIQQDLNYHGSGRIVDTSKSQCYIRELDDYDIIVHFHVATRDYFNYDLTLNPIKRELVHFSQNEQVYLISDDTIPAERVD